MGQRELDGIMSRAQPARMTLARQPEDSAGAGESSSRSLELRWRECHGSWRLESGVRLDHHDAGHAVQIVRHDYRYILRMSLDYPGALRVCERIGLKIPD